MIADEDMVVTITHKGYIKRLPTTTWRAQRRGGKGMKGAKTKDDDFVEHLLIASTHNTMLFFTNKGKCHWLKVHQIPPGSRTSQGRAIINLINCEQGEKIEAFVSVKEFNETDHIVMATKKGIIKRSALKLYSKPRKGGIYAIEIKEGDVITIDGSTGRIILGEVSTVKPEISGDFSKLMNWADGYRKLKIRTNSETPIDTKTARDFGAEGIGLCRTEHMFFDEERILSVREMILSKTKEDRNKALEKLLPYQKKDFIEIFKIMNGLPVTVRLLDPPLHEFLPKNEKEINDVSKALNLSNKEINSRIGELHEHNPMLGHRGCRLGISFPEIYEMQCRAIFESLVHCKKNKYRSITPEIMIPLVSTEAEIKIMKNLVNRIAEKIQNENNIKIDAPSISIPNFKLTDITTGSTTTSLTVIEPQEVS